MKLFSWLECHSKGRVQKLISWFHIGRDKLRNGLQEADDRGSADFLKPAQAPRNDEIKRGPNRERPPNALILKRQMTQKASALQPLVAPPHVDWGGIDLYHVESLLIDYQIKFST